MSAEGLKRQRGQDERLSLRLRRGSGLPGGGGGGEADNRIHNLRGFEGESRAGSGRGCGPGSLSRPGECTGGFGGEVNARGLRLGGPYLELPTAYIYQRKGI